MVMSYYVIMISCDVMICHSHHYSECQDILPSYTIELGSLSEKVFNVKDFQFLHSYNNPTVFILYEPTPTWAGCVVVYDYNSLLLFSFMVAH